MEVFPNRERIAAQLNPCVPLFPSSSSILTSSADKENVNLPSTSTTTNNFINPLVFHGGVPLISPQLTPLIQ